MAAELYRKTQNCLKGVIAKMKLADAHNVEAVSMEEKFERHMKFLYCFFMEQFLHVFFI